jgi:hypothetical protein
MNILEEDVVLFFCSWSKNESFKITSGSYTSSTCSPNGRSLSSSETAQNNILKTKIVKIREPNETHHTFHQ